MAGALAIDPGKTTGWARPGLAGVLPLAGIDDEGRATAAFMQWLADQLSENRPDRLLIERAFFTGRFANADFTMGLIRCAHAVAFLHDVPRSERTAREVRRLSPQPCTTDRERVARARELGFRFVTPPGQDEAAVANHAADAALLLHVASAGHG